jgi:hypothetical protein
MVRKVVLILALGLICMAAAYADACYSSVSAISATCTGGSITQDAISGNCRTFVCASGSNSVKVLACDKPDSGTKQYFEMYRQSYSGTVPKLCLDGACIQYNGYQKSANYPICVGTVPNTTNTTNSTPSQNTSTNTTPTTSACYSRVNDLPSSCSGGTITRDDKGGCRTIVCSNGGNSLQTLACDKGGYFEMYRQTQVGSTSFNICIGNTCLGNNGYAKSPNYPICIASNNTNTSLPPQNASGTVQLVIDPLSKDLNFIFSCNVTGFKAKSYTFNFGDGTSETKNESIYYPYKYDYNTGGQYNVTGVKAMHFLPGEKTYAVSCTATDGINTATKTLSVSPITPYMPPDYQYSPQFGSYLTIARIANSTYNITVHTIGFVPDYLAYWQIHDPNNNSAYIYGQEQGMSNIVAIPYPATWNVGVDTASFEHGYESNHYDSCLGENGYDYCEYEATICGRSHLGCMSLSNWKDLIVPSSDFQSIQSNTQTTVTIASGYPQGNNYIFNCNAFNFTPTKYDFTFGDGQSWTNVTFNNSYHTYPNPGTYEITCTAKNDQISRTASLTINVGGSNPSNSTCYNKVNDIPASCTGGSITTDNKAGCRTLICTNGDSSMQVLACDKTGFFEMYKQSSSGTAVSKICIGTTCISDNGYAKSGNYPICS